MDDRSMPAPVRLTGPAAWRWALRFGLDPLMATRRAHTAFGPFIVLAEALPFMRRPRAPMLNVPLVLTASAAFQRELLSDPETWRGVSLLPGGPRNSAARRMSVGLTRMTGQRHAHYRKLLAPPLRKPNVEALAQSMAKIAQAEVESWQPGEGGDLWDYSRRLMWRFAVGLLLGGPSKQADAIADKVSRLMEHKWGWGAFVPINLPFTPYGRIVR